MMRPLVCLLVLALTACALAPPPVPTTDTTLFSADAATSLAVGQSLIMSVAEPVQGDAGQDPLMLMTLRHPDGRSMSFVAANHAPFDVMAQAPGGPLALVMGVPSEAPTLYHLRPEENEGAAFLCPAENPVSIGIHQAPDGSVSLVGLRGSFSFETLADGAYAPLPFSPDLVCTRLRFTRL